MGDQISRSPAANLQMGSPEPDEWLSPEDVLAMPPPEPRRRRPARQVLTELWHSRELLETLVTRDLKIRYKGSVLGFAWSMVTPLALVLVFGFIFTKAFVIPGTPNFSLFFLTGYLPWQLFAGSLSDSVVVLVHNGSLLRQINFPREYLPLSKVLAQTIHFLLSLLVLFAFALILGYNFFPFLGVLVLTVTLHLAFVLGLSMGLAAVNVVFRDLQELLQVILLIWFYATPLIYRLEQLPSEYRWIILLNPMTWYMDLYRHSLYYLVFPPIKVVLVCAALSCASLAVGYVLFIRLAHRFCKEL